MKEFSTNWARSVLLVLTLALAGCQFDVTDLGTLPGGSESWANAINEEGVIVGASENAAGHLRATRWNPDGTVDDLGTLGGAWSEAHGVNNLGVVVGESLTSTGEVHAFFTWGNTMHDLGPGAAFDVNDNIWITGRGPFEDPSHAQGVVWKWAEAPTDLVPADPSVEEAWGYAINEQNEIAGTREDCDGPQGVFKWTEAGVIDPPLAASIPEGCYTFGRDINGFGAIAGFAIFGDSLPGLRQAAVFKPTGVQRLQAFSDSRGLGNNNLGWVVGDRKVDVRGGADRHEPFVWFTALGTHDVLPMLAGEEGSAAAVSEKGVAVGWSTLANGQRRAVRWDPKAQEPEPVDDFKQPTPDPRDEPDDFTRGPGVPPLPPEPGTSLKTS